VKFKADTLVADRLLLLVFFLYWKDTYGCNDEKMGL